MTSTNVSRRPDNDPFIGLLTWLVNSPDGGDGSIVELAVRGPVPVRILREWHGGRYPVGRRREDVAELDQWARMHVRGYPRTELGGSGLMQLSQPVSRRSRPVVAQGPTTDAILAPRAFAWRAVWAVLASLLVVVIMVVLGLAVNGDEAIGGPAGAHHRPSVLVTT